MALEVFSLEFVQHLAEAYGYWAVLGGVLLENTGLPIPGETITLVGGFLAGSDDLRYEGVLAAAIAGAILGDNFGYWLGRWGGWSLLSRVGSWFKIPEQRLLQAKEQFSNNAMQAVFLGRFVTLLRVFAGPLAGIAGMPYSKFLLCNAAGAVVWAAAIVSLAFFVGRLVSLEQLLVWVSQFGLLALAALAVWGLAYWLLSQRRAPSDV
ncbi:MAG: DedA family protein [Synechococcales cyanobacterium RM1_1_8]|nr:DedA family protein [Synechococcales cyanobacterium RM1_1_8]